MIANLVVTAGVKCRDSKSGSNSGGKTPGSVSVNVLAYQQHGAHGGPWGKPALAATAAEMLPPQVMGPGILPTRDFGDGHAVYEKAAMLGKRRMTPQRGGRRKKPQLLKAPT